MNPTNLITGASSGIGLELTRQLAKQGRRVLAIARSKDRLSKAIAGLDESHLIEPVALDVTDTAALEDAVSNRTFDLVVANAGICQQARLDEDDAVAVWRRSLDVNLDAAFHTLRLTHSNITDGGSFIAISSGLGKQGRAAYSAYCASKHGLLGLVRASALELAPRIRVNAICPGWVDTPMSKSDIECSASRQGSDADALRQRIVSELPLKRPVEPGEVAEMALWLASPGASAITGQAYNICSGEFTL